MIWRRMIYQGKDLGDYYLISDTGEIKSVKTGKIRRQSETKKGYACCSVSLGSRNNKVCVRVHKAVAESFIDNPLCKPEVNHKDGDKKNNVASNLEWVTSKENMEHSVKHGLNHATHSEKHWAAKLNEDLVRWVRSVYKPYDKQFGLIPLSKLLGVDKNTLFPAIHRKTWGHIEDVV